MKWLQPDSGGSPITGYNIYRGTVSGGPYSQVNIAVNADTTYTDTTVLAGQTYFFVTTAVDSTGGESGFSNQATAAVPTP